MSDTVLIEDREGVRILTLNRPEKKNAINNEMWIALREAFAHAGEDNDVACALITGAGVNFSSGVDLASFADATAG